MRTFDLREKGCALTYLGMYVEAMLRDEESYTLVADVCVCCKLRCSRDLTLQKLPNDLIRGLTAANFWFGEVEMA